MKKLINILQIFKKVLTSMLLWHRVSGSSKLGDSIQGPECCAQRVAKLTHRFPVQVRLITNRIVYPICKLTLLHPFAKYISCFMGWNFSQGMCVFQCLRGRRIKQIDASHKKLLIIRSKKVSTRNLLDPARKLRRKKTELGVLICINCSFRSNEWQLV